MDLKMFKYGFVFGFFAIGIAAYIGYKIISRTSDIDILKTETLNMDGKPINFDDYKAKPLVINLWSTTCAPCVEELPYFEKLHSKYKNEVNFILLSAEDLPKIKKFKEKKGYQIFFGKSVKSFKKSELNQYLPSTFIYDKDGVLVTKIKGTVTKDELEKNIKKVLSK